jgi:hypothetical protein
VDSIDSISKKISNLDTELISFCPDNELVIDSYADVRTSSSGHDDNMFGFGNLEIDYRAPKQVTRRSSVSTRGLRVLIDLPLSSAATMMQLYQNTLSAYFADPCFYFYYYPV